MRRRKRSCAAQVRLKPMPIQVSKRFGGKFNQMKQFVPLIGGLALSAREVRVWLALWNIEHGQCREFFASGAHIGKETGMRREHASAAMAKLVKRGLLVRVMAGRSKGFATVWRIPLCLRSTSASTGTGSTSADSHGTDAGRGTPIDPIQQ